MERFKYKQDKFEIDDFQNFSSESSVEYIREKKKSVESENSNFTQAEQPKQTISKNKSILQIEKKVISSGKELDITQNEITKKELHKFSDNSDEEQNKTQSLPKQAAIKDTDGQTSTERTPKNANWEDQFINKMQLQSAQEQYFDECEIPRGIFTDFGNNTYNQNKKIARQEMANDFHQEFLNVYNQTDLKFCLQVVQITVLERLSIYTDAYPFLNQRKKLLKIKIIFSDFCSKLIKNQNFEIISLLVIVVNSVTMAMDDPTSSTPNEVLLQFEMYFLVFYTLEIFLKICGTGFILQKGSFMRDAMNILDFFIVASAYMQFLLTTSSSFNFASLRVVRVLRPLRTIGRISTLKIIISALFDAVSLLKDSLFFILFFYTLFAIAGLHLFDGTLKKRCYFSETGMEVINQAFCSDNDSCSKYLDEIHQSKQNLQMVCGRMVSNPYFGYQNFDSFGSAFFQVFMVVTLEGWADLAFSVSQTTSNFALFYKIITVFYCYCNNWRVSVNEFTISDYKGQIHNGQ